MTQEQLAKKAQMTQEEVSRAESGTHDISLNTLFKITNALGVRIVLDAW